MSSIVFPPYGALARAYVGQVAQPRPPTDFADPSLWAEFIQDAVSAISALLWPEWDYNAHSWANPNADQMTALTRADFAIFKETGFDPPLLSEVVRSPDGVGWIPTHEVFFLDEDADGLGVRAPTYSVAMPKEVAAQFPQKMRDALRSKVGTASMEVKSRIQRPRAYQVALLVGEDFHWTTGASSMSPSMSSGHSLQGLMMTAGVVDAYADGDSLTDVVLAALEQYAVDVGDRRVRAGIHYPSDNLASWLIAARLAQRVLKSAAARQFVRRAILERSEVWRSLKSAAVQHEVLNPALAAVEAELASLSA